MVLLSLAIRISTTFLAFSASGVVALDSRVRTFPGHDIAPGFLVLFNNGTYKVAEHLKKINGTFQANEIKGLGYHANLSDADIAKVYTDSRVRLIEQNHYGKRGGPLSRRVSVEQSQTGAGYALTFLSQKQQNPTDNTYYYPENAGAGVDVYIIDSGITANSGEFGDRLENGRDYTGLGFQDDDGHGTMVAACAAGTKFGTSKVSTIWNYKDGDDIPVAANTAQALTDIVTANAARKGMTGYKGAVINISSTLADSQTLKDAINAALLAGIPVIVAAGNGHIDADTTAPCYYTNVICVGGISNQYAQGAESNYGAALTLYAPGDDIATLSNEGEPRITSGTSFASPYVAGIAAIFYGVEGTAMTIARVKALLLQNADNDIITGVLGSGPNVLANNGKQKAGTGPYLGAPIPSASVSVSSSTRSFLVTPAPTFHVPIPEVTPVSCSLQEEDPDQGINTEYCACGSYTLPLLSVATTAEESAQCAYTTLPTSAVITVSTGFQSTTTNTALCQICSQVEAFGDSCTTYANCLPQVPQASVTVATSAVHVGILTGSPLYTSISNALESICPPVTQTTSSTQCSGTATIPDITYVEDETIGYDGELDVTAAFSAYNSTSLRDAMIKSLAYSAMSSAGSSSNCYDQPYTVEELKRDLLGIEGPRNMSSFDHDQTGIATRDHPYPEVEHITLCNTAELALVNYYSQFWRFAPEPGPTDFIEAQYSFHLPPGGTFLCEFLETLIDELAIIQPEFAVEDIELGEAIDAVCAALEGS